MNIRKFLRSSAETPGALFFSYDEIRSYDGRIKPEFFKLAHDAKRSEIRIAVYGAKLTDENLKELRDWKVTVTQSGFEEAFRRFGRRGKKNVIASSRRSELREYLPLIRSARVSALLAPVEITFHGALVLALSDGPAFGFGKDAEGFHLIRSELRRALLARQSSLVFASAA